MRGITKRLVALSLSAVLLMGCGSTSTTTEKEEDFTVKLPTGEVESSIFVEKINGISDDYIRGVDVSSVLAEEESGVVYYNEAGEEQDIFQTLAEAGVNYVRIRVWNDPYDEDGNPYGGGNNNVQTAITLGKRATKYGLKVCVDFHYSDFWADPAKQMVPKAWEDMDVEKKSESVYIFTKKSLIEMLRAGIDIGMVQVGNEINNGMSGEDFSPNVHKLLRAGCKGVREAAEERNHDMKIVIHYTDMDATRSVQTLVAGLYGADIDYDVLGLSYYPFWHCDMQTMQSVVQDIQENYGKEVIIAETSYVYTLEDGDGFSNSVGEKSDLVEGYPATVQGQANMLRDVFAAAHDAGATGVFYWEPAWIPVGPADQDNSEIWETYGSGWASSYAASYDPEDAGQYYGGSSWDNQALFDFTGHPLASLNVFKYLKYGAVAERRVDDIPDVTVEFEVSEFEEGQDLTLPETVQVLYNDKSTEEVPVEWNLTDITKIDLVNGGNYEVRGTLEDGSEAICQVKISMTNFLENPSFEDEDLSMWNMTHEGLDNPTDIQDKADDANTGTKAYHWWSNDDMEFSVEQTVTDLPEGNYQFTIYAQGGDVTEDAELEIYVVVDDTEQTETFTLAGWANWQTPVIEGIQVREGEAVTVGVRAKMNAKSWGTFDDFALNRTGNLPEN